MQIKAHAKVNIFLKITGYRDGYHTLISRFMQVKELYDTISFVECECDSFTIEGCDNIPKESNTIYRAYKALNEATGDLELLDFFYHHKVVVDKKIPSQAGLGGGSSDAGAFMRLVHRVCNLKISIDELAKIGSTIGADVPFFVYNYPSANVSGFGEIVKEFKEESLSLEIQTPPIACDTKAVYQTFKREYLSKIDPFSYQGWERINSKELLEEIKEPKILNDLYPSALQTCPKLQEYIKDSWFFSGSGSSFFRIK